MGCSSNLLRLENEELEWLIKYDRVNIIFPILTNVSSLSEQIGLFQFSLLFSVLLYKVSSHIRTQFAVFPRPTSTKNKLNLDAIKPHSDYQRHSTNSQFVFVPENDMEKIFYGNLKGKETWV